MKKKRTWTVVLIAAVIGVVVLAFFLLHRPPRPEMELLEILPPDLDLYAVADVQSLGTSPVMTKLIANPPGVPQDKDYENFIQATGFHYQDDLKRVALGKAGADWVGAARVRVERARMIQYLESQSAEKSEALGKTIFSFGHFRPLRLVFLDENPRESLLAFTIGGDESRIRQAVQRHAGDLEESAASEFKREHALSHIPPKASNWLIGKPERLWQANGPGAQLGSFAIGAALFQGSKTLYASLENGPAQLDLRVEAYCDSPASAQRIANSLQGLLALVRGMPAGKAAETASLLSGITIQQAEQSVFLRWQLDERALAFLESASR